MSDPHGELPHDPDVEVGDPAGARTAAVDLASVGLVFAGGAVGTLVRYLLGDALPDPDGIPITIFAINVTGAFLLGWLLEGLARRGPDEGRRRRMRLLLGTGVLGGYTTYSAFAVDTDGLLAADRFVAAAGYGVATVLVGAAASVAGIALAAWLHRRRTR